MERCLLLLLLLCLAGCAPKPYTQVVSGHLTQGGVAVQNTPVRFSLSSTDQPYCEPPTASGLTDETGRFELKATYTPARLEAFAVVIHHHAVCVQVGGRWVRTWLLVTGPAQKKVVLACLIEKDESVSCTSQ